MSQSAEILTLSVKATGAILPRRFVSFAGAQLAVAGADAFGVAQYGAAIGELVSVVRLGTAVVDSGAAVAIGDPIKTDASGRAIAQGGTGAILGKALSAASGADQKIEIVLPA
jgi:hypothetical protein